jgi:YjbE family integral membrane protein
VGVLGALLQIVLINIILSGDNAVVIGMAAQPLPTRQRRLAILLGGGAAIVLRVLLTAVAAYLLGLPALKAIGGALLLWIAFQLLEKTTEVHEDAKAKVGMWAAITTILVADLIMSLDNVLGVAAASNGDLGLLVFGLAFSMIIVMLGGGVFAELIDRLWWLTYLGALVIAWTGVDMTFSDDLVQRVIEPVSEPVRLVITAVLSLAVVAAAHVFHRRAPARRPHALSESGPPVR